ncbi:MAG: hypothetical protein PWQ06_1229 [Anaerophaga sp.]|nr:hypothetical protein [Anaerophaga sp.]
MHDFQFPALGAGTFKALPARGDPAVITIFGIVDNKSSNLSGLFTKGLIV